jgi:outer membrane protein
MVNYFAGRAARLAVSTLSVLLLVPEPGLCQSASEVRVDPVEGRAVWLTAPYRPRSVPPVNLANTSRLDSLIRAGNLYLNAQDVVALAIENNIDVEVQRYGPILAREVLRRAQGGGVLRSVGLGVAPGPQSVSLTGVSVGAVGSGISAGSGVSSGGGILTQLGPSIPSLDPSLSAFANFGHNTSPQSNTFLTGTTAFVTSTRTYQTQYSQNFPFGLSAQLAFTSQFIHVNSNQFNLNPYRTGNVDLQVTQNLLQGFGTAVNTRNIRVQKNNLKVTDLQFQLQLITTVSATLNLYWDLVAFHQDVRARDAAVRTAEQLFNNNKRQVELGSLAEIEVTRAESQLYSTKQDLVVSQTNLMQQETILKNALSRNGVAGPELAQVRIVPLDQIAVPKAEPPLQVEPLYAEAIGKRPEIQQSRINLESNHMNLVGIRNSLRPSLQAFAEATNNGLTGDLTALGLLQGGLGSPLAGGYGGMLGQIFRRNYPNYSAGFSLNIPLRNRAAQSDYVTSLIEIRQNELNLQKNLSQVRVDVQNAVIGVEQARARYEAAAKARSLAEDTLAADQKKLTLGAGTNFQVVQDQRDLANAQSQETQALANYTHARISFDQALGRTLEVNNISIGDALKGQGGPPSNPPPSNAAPAKEKP